MYRLCANILYMSHDIQKTGFENVLIFILKEGFAVYFVYIKATNPGSE